MTSFDLDMHTLRIYERHQCFSGSFPCFYRSLLIGAYDIVRNLRKPQLDSFEECWMYQRS